MHRLTMLLASILAVVCLGASARTDGARTIFAPNEDKAVVLHNPDMGWVLYENYPLDQRPGGASTLVNLPNESFPEVDAVAIMFSWQDIEKSKDVYDFSKVDYAYDYWKSRGKTIHLRMSVESLLWWSGLNPPTGQGVPGYVLDALPPEKKQVRTCEGLAYVVVDARDTYYQDRLGKFLRAVAKHFRTRPVTLVDLRGFGLWGEWHSGYKYPTLEDRIQTLKQIIDTWSANLPGHTLALSYSYDPDSPPEYYAGPTDSYVEKYAEQYKDFARYSGFDYALSRPNVVLRRDGVGGCVHSNERRFIREAFDKHCKGTFVAEFCGGYSSARNSGDKQVRWMVNDALSLHPNYINLLGWQTEDALLFCSERPDLIKHGLLNMGYRLVPVEINLPAKMQSGGQVDLRSLWANRAEGCALVDFKLKLLLADTVTGKIAYETDLGPMPTSKWTKGRYYAVNRSFTLGRLRSGDYDLLIELIDPRTAKPIQLPLSDAPTPGLYRVGKITISTGR